METLILGCVLTDQAALIQEVGKDTQLVWLGTRDRSTNVAYHKTLPSSVNPCAQHAVLLPAIRERRKGQARGQANLG